jgi:hypothetical protein
MEEQNALEKKKRCPKGFIRNKEGICVPKVAKPTEMIENDIPTKVPKEKVPKEKVPKEKVPKEKVLKEKVNTKKVSSKAIGKKVSPKAKTMKKMTKIQTAKLLAERRECIQKFRNKLTIIH